MLSEHATQISLASFGRPIALFAASPLQFFRDHRHAGSIPAGIEDRNGAMVTGSRVGQSFLPTLRLLADPLHHPLNLPGRYLDAAGLLQVSLGFEVGGFISPF